MKIDKSNSCVIDNLIKENDDFAELIKCKNDFLTVAVTRDNAKRLIHSKYDPVKEARNQVNAFVKNVRGKQVYMVFGLGMGYHIFELLKHLPVEGKALIFEPSAKILKLFLENSGKAYLDDNRLTFFCMDTKTVAEDVNEVITLDNCESIAFYCHPVYESIYKDAFETLVKAINRAITDCLVQKNSIRTFGKNWCRNFFLNYEFIKQSSAVNNLFGLFEGKTAVIVSAGPSLDKNVSLIKAAKGKAVIISTDTAYRALKSCDTEPDLVISVSGNSYAYNKLKGIDCTAPLVFKDQTANEIVSAHSGLKFYSNYINDYFHSMLTELGISTGRLESGGSVACTALDLAVKMGVGKVIFVGQDLALAGDKTHANNTTVPISLKKNKAYIIETTDIYGNSIRTLKNLNDYRLWIEAYIRCNTHVNFIDATEGGAVIEGTSIMDFASAIADIPNNTLNAPSMIKQCFNLMLSKKDNEAVIKGYETAYNNYLNAVEIVKELIKTYPEKTGLPWQKMDSAIMNINYYTFAIRYAVMPFLFELKQVRIKKTPVEELRVFNALLSELEDFRELFLFVLEEI